MEQALIIPDTDVLIYGLNGKEPYAEKIKHWIATRSLLISPVVVCEFLTLATPEEKKIMFELILKFDVLVIDGNTAITAAEIRTYELKRKVKFHLGDCLIAAQCQIHHATLATNNPSDYPKDLPKFTF